MTITVTIEALGDMCGTIVHLRKQRDELHRSLNTEVEVRRKIQRKADLTLIEKYSAESELRELRDQLKEFEEGLQIIHTPDELFELYGAADEKELDRLFYKDTECGAWLEILDGPDDVLVKIGSIVEGSDATVETDLKMPFTLWHWRKAVKYVDEESARLWEEAANG